MEYKELLTKWKDYFNLNIDMDEEDSIIQNVTGGAELKGANLWILIFAIVIASIGLNVNSPAVIIGAMLISPLMGPLIAIGLGLSINDFELIKLALRNLSFALCTSLIASTLYFLITPLDQAQTEILARTSPTIFDVFIAFSGGLAGMIGNTRKVRGNVLPGVAIATALMPPLCTAGFGVASGNWTFFFGAFYLFIINCVFIFLGTFLVCQMMHFKKRVFVNKSLGRKIRLYIYAMITLTVIPSSFLAYKMIHNSLTERKINEFLSTEVSSHGLVIVEKKISRTGEKTLVELAAVGPSISAELQAMINAKLSSYGLDHTTVSFKNVGAHSTDIVAIKSAILKDLYLNNEEVLKDKDNKISLLEKELVATRLHLLPIEDIKSELKIILPVVSDLLLAKTTSAEGRSVLLASLQLQRPVLKPELEKARIWLRTRTKSDEVKLMHEQVRTPFKTAER